jgi:hypothetical protein
LDIKVILREGARARRISVLMATSDRGLVDVERFDLEPQRQILHGLLGELDVALLPGMSSREKVPHMLRFLEAERLSPRMAASVVDLRSGRIHLDVGWVINQLDEPEMARDRPIPPAECSDPAVPGVPGVITAAAIRAPSGGNAQPWHIELP